MRRDTRSIRRSVNGFLLLNKPLYLTSNAALQRVKSLFNAKKAGHTGSLDPLATGMLPICFGEATKFAQYVLEADKRYAVTAQLGIKTTTGDAEGEIVSQKPVGDLSSDVIASVLSRFCGEIQQVPSMFSALKHQGQPLYKLARKGIEIERPARTITVYAIDLITQRADQLVLHIHCSKGTYIRNLIEDIGEAFKCGAHVAQLHRQSVGAYPSDRMVTLETLETLQTQAGTTALDHYLLPVDQVLQDCVSLPVTAAMHFYLRAGQAVRVPHAPRTGHVKLYSEHNQFLGIGEILEDGRIAPKRLLQDDMR